MTTFLLWIKSYQNHVILCSVYVGVGIACLKSVQQEMAASGHDIIYHPLCILQQIVAATAVLLFFAEVNYVYKRLTLPPGDSGVPILGELPKLIQQGPRELFLDNFKTYGTPFTHNMLMTPTVVVATDSDINTWITHERKGNAIPSILPQGPPLLLR